MTAAPPAAPARFCAAPLDAGPLPGLVAITGVAGNLGRLLAKLLHTETSLVGVDRRPWPERPKDVVHHEVDIRKRKVEEVFRRHQVEALVHLGVMHDPRVPFSEAHAFNILGTRKLLDLCVAHGVKKVVLLSSADAYGPAPENSNFLGEEAPLMAADRYSDVRDLIELDMLVQSFLWQHPEIETVILRPVHIVGPTIRNGPSNYLRLPRPLTVLGFDPMIQLVHAEDVCRAIALALRPGARGVFNVTGPGEVPLSLVLRELGRRPLPVPHLVVRPFLRRAYDLRLVDFPPEQADYLQYLCAVDGARAREVLGYAPRRTLRETIRSVEEQAAPG